MTMQQELARLATVSKTLKTMGGSLPSGAKGRSKNLTQSSIGHFYNFMVLYLRNKIISISVVNYPFFLI